MIALLAASAVSMVAAPVPAASREPLIVTQMADPDPNFVAPRDEAHRRNAVSSDAPYDDERIDEAMLNLGRVIGEAALVQQQQIEAKCRQGPPDNATPEQRFAWAASCRYARH